MKKKVGILGGGQLGRMVIEGVYPLDVKIFSLDANNAPCAAALPSEQFVVGNFKDASDIARFAEKVDVLTIEIEHVNCDAMEEAEKKSGKHVQPSVSTIRTIQDKYLQHCFYRDSGLPCAEFCDAPDQAAVTEAAKTFGYPLLLKAKKNAYDGYGNALVRSAEDVPSAFEKLTGGRGSQVYVEKFCPFVKELAVMVARSLDGKVVSYPCVETIHANHVVRLVIAPALVPAEVREKARRVAEDAVSHLSGAGVFGVEMFLLKDGSVLLNEIAPRPHNSGHYTIEACECSQFEQHMRAVSGLPLGSTAFKGAGGAAVMVNVLGRDVGEKGFELARAPILKALELPGAYAHWYGKAETKPGRKMGHVTLVGSDMGDVLARTRTLLGAIGELALPGFPPVPEGICTPPMVAALTAIEEGTVQPLVGIIMGSDSDLPKMKPACEMLRDLQVPFEVTVVSAHRTPHRMVEYAEAAAGRGLKVIIAAAGGAAHLPGMTASLTSLPVIGVPIALKFLDGVDSLHSIVQMPKGIPVATVAIDNSANAALLAARIVSAFLPRVAANVEKFQKESEQTVLKKVEVLKEKGWEAY